MSDILKLLDGSIDEVKAGLHGQSHDDLVRLKAAEQDGKNRKGVLDALDQATSDADTKRLGGRVQGAATHATIAADFDGSGPAGIEPATAFNPSGAADQVVPDVDPAHPAVDNNPREGTTVHQNKIDFNDPKLTGADAVESMLKGGHQS